MYGSGFVSVRVDTEESDIVLNSSETLSADQAAACKEIGQMTGVLLLCFHLAESGV